MGVEVPATGSRPTGGSARLRDATRQSEHWPVGRIAAGLVAAAWLALVGVVLAGWIGYAPAAFIGAGAFTFVMFLVLVYDAAVDWADPEEHESLARRLQPERAWPGLQRAAAFVRTASVPACFVVGVVVGHFAWH